MAAADCLWSGAVSDPLIGLGVDAQAVVGEHFDEVGVALQRIGAEVGNGELAALDQSQCQEVAGRRDVWLDRVDAIARSFIVECFE